VSDFFYKIGVGQKFREFIINYYCVLFFSWFSINMILVVVVVFFKKNWKWGLSCFKESIKNIFFFLFQDFPFYSFCVFFFYLICAKKLIVFIIHLIIFHKSWLMVMRWIIILSSWMRWRMISMISIIIMMMMVEVRIRIWVIGRWRRWMRMMIVGWIWWVGWFRKWLRMTYIKRERETWKIIMISIFKNSITAIYNYWILSHISYLPL